MTANDQANANKRRYPRLPVSIKVDGRWWGVDGDQHKLTALLVFISEGGAQLRTAELVPANSAIEFTLRLGTLKRFDPKGTVRWWRRNGEVRDLGVEFAEPIARLGLYVEKQMAAAAKAERAALADK